MAFKIPGPFWDSGMYTDISQHHRSDFVGGGGALPQALPALNPCPGNTTRRHAVAQGGGFRGGAVEVNGRYVLLSDGRDHQIWAT